MSKNNLYKGFEVELFTGSLDSHIGVSADIEKKFSLSAFVKVFLILELISIYFACFY